MDQFCVFRIVRDIDIFIRIAFVVIKHAACQFPIAASVLGESIPVRADAVPALETTDGKILMFA